jgi:aminomethyltransferase
MGYCLYGNDIDDSTSPIEAGLGWITKLKEKGDFVGRHQIEKIRQEGPEHKLVGFKLEGRRVARKAYLILDEEGNKIGRVTSGTLSPSLGYPIGMGYVKTDFAKLGTPILIDAGRKQFEAKVAKRPFIEI